MKSPCTATDRQVLVGSRNVNHKICKICGVVSKGETCRIYIINVYYSCPVIWFLCIKVFVYRYWWSQARIEYFVVILPLILALCNIDYVSRLCYSCIEILMFLTYTMVDAYFFNFMMYAIVLFLYIFLSLA